MVPNYFENQINFLTTFPLNYEVDITKKTDSMFNTVKTLFDKTMNGTAKIFKVI